MEQAGSMVTPLLWNINYIPLLANIYRTQRILKSDPLKLIYSFITTFMFIQ